MSCRIMLCVPPSWVQTGMRLGTEQQSTAVIGNFGDRAENIMPRNGRRNMRREEEAEKRNPPAAHIGRRLSQDVMR